MQFFTIRLKRRIRSFLLLSLYTLLFSLCAGAQAPEGFIKGTIMDGTSFRPIHTAYVSADSGKRIYRSYYDGHFTGKLDKGTHILRFSFPGYQTLVVRDVKIKSNEITYIDILMQPVSANPEDSAGNNPITTDTSADNAKDSRYVTLRKENQGSRHHPLWNRHQLSDIISSPYINPGTDKNGSQLVQHLNGAIPVNDGPLPLQELMLAGWGSRYNQLLLNGLPFAGFDAAGRSFPLSLIPSEAIQSASLAKPGDISIPADYAGGVVDIVMKDIPEQNFLYIQAGAGFSEGTPGELFYGDLRGNFESLALPGNHKNLTAGFPDSRSEFSLSQKNIQERTDLLKRLNNNLGALNNGRSQPDQKLMIGYGKVKEWKSGAKWGLTAYLTQQKNQRIESSSTQVSPDIEGNPYPYVNTGQLIRAQSNDVHYQYSSSLSGVANTSVIYGHNKFSFKNFFGSFLTNTYTQRSGVVKPDEDPGAHSGVYFNTQHHRFLNTRLSGEHALGSRHNLLFTWQASYMVNSYKSPDERNFLLTQDSTNAAQFEIARQLSSPAITRTGRLWKSYTDHHFVAAFHLSVPFTIRKSPTLLKGGLYTETKDRLLNSDLLLYSGQGYFTQGELIAPERYYPGGLSAENYYVKAELNAGQLIFPENTRGDYKASSNISASYINLEHQLLKSLKLNLGLRLESDNQLVSNIQYYNLDGFKNEQYTSIDANANVINFNMLPSARVIYSYRDIQWQAGYIKTLNRVSLQDLSYYSSYDPVTFMVKTGNPYLRNSEISNYDAVVRWLPYSGTTLSFSGFYKVMDQPVEDIITQYESATMLSTPYNTSSATVRGLSADLRLELSSLISSFNLPVVLYANGTWQKSKVKAGDIGSTSIATLREHSLTGVADYAINAGLVISHPSYPQIHIQYNRTGDYISALGSGSVQKLDNGNSITSIADYRIKGRDLLDLQVSQKFFASRFQLIAGVHNLLSSDYILYQDMDGNSKWDDPLIVTSPVNNAVNGSFISGTDNPVFRREARRTFYFTLSYLFNQ